MAHVVVLCELEESLEAVTEAKVVGGKDVGGKMALDWWEDGSQRI